MNNIIYNTDDDFDEESGSVLKQSRFLNFEQVFQNSTNPLEETIKRSRSGNSLENTSLPNRFGKDSIFYQAKEDSLRHFLESRNLYQPAKSKYEGIDLEKILINITDFNNIDDLPYFCKKGNRLRIIQYTAEEPNSLDEYLKKYFTINSKKISTYTDNFIWFTEGEDSNLITFHLFAYDNRISEIICTMGSDIFDCLKSTTNVNSSGGFIIRNNKDENIVNPVLDDFKKEIAKRVEKLYYSNNAIDSDKKFYIRTEELIEALDREFQAEGDYQRTIDWIFEKMEITTSFKDFVNKLHDYSKDIQYYRLGEERYLPFHPNFDPIFNDTLLKAFGINPNIKIEDYFLEWDQEDIEKFKLVEKEVNVAYGFNAFFCGLWNALVDTIDGFVLMIPELHEIFTDRAKFKSFLHLIKELFEHINEWEDKINEWELKNSSYSVYRYEYFQTYGTILILSLFLPLPKLAKGGKSAEAFTFFAQTSRTFIESEIILSAYRLGLRVEKTSSEWKLFFYDTLLSSGSKEKITKRIGNIMEVAIKNPNIVFKLLPERKLAKLVDFKRGKGIKGLPKNKFLTVQAKLYNKNIATARFEVYHQGKKIIKEFKAYSGNNISELDGLGFSKSPNLRGGELKSDFSEIINGDITGRFLDTESKIFREFEDVHLKQIMKDLGAKGTDELRIEVNLQTILDPCTVCQGQMSKFQKLHNAKIKIYSSGAKNGEKLIELYSKHEVKRPLK